MRYWAIPQVVVVTLLLWGCGNDGTTQPDANDVPVDTVIDDTGSEVVPDSLEDWNDLGDVLPDGCEPEECNGLDDDCDGIVDDGLGQTTCGVGECTATTANCIGGAQQMDAQEPNGDLPNAPARLDFCPYQ